MKPQNENRNEEKMSQEKRPDNAQGRSPKDTRKEADGSRPDNKYDGTGKSSGAGK